MCDELVWSFDAITGLPWLEIIKALAPLATAFIAFLALRNWKRQDKAKRQAEFLDQLIDASHGYITEMSAPIAVLESVLIGIESYAPIEECEDRSVKGAIAYIQKRGDAEAKRLFNSLAAAEPATVRMRSLAAKGQVFRFEGYAKCLNAIARLTWHFDRLEALAAIIGSTSWNWENSEVLSTVRNVIDVDAEKLRKQVREDSVAILDFCRATYSHIYD